MDSSGNGREDATPAGAGVAGAIVRRAPRRLGADLSRLVRQEMALARAEIVDRFADSAFAPASSHGGALAFAAYLYPWRRR